MKNLKDINIASLQ